VSDFSSPLLALAIAGGILIVGSLSVLMWEVPVASDAGVSEVGE
jgi:hypothetical protein